MNYTTYKKESLNDIIVLFLIGTTALIMGLFIIFTHRTVTHAVAITIALIIPSICTFAEMIKNIKNRNAILRFMREDKYIICKNFKHITRISDDAYDDDETYSITEAIIMDSNGHERLIESERYAQNKNPFDDNRDSIKIFIDINDPKSPYYMIP